MKGYRSSVQVGRWFFGFTVRRFSFFVAWKCETTWIEWARMVRNTKDGE